MQPVTRLRNLAFTGKTNNSEFSPILDTCYWTTLESHNSLLREVQEERYISLEYLIQENKVNDVIPFLCQLLVMPFFISRLDFPKNMLILRFSPNLMYFYNTISVLELCNFKLLKKSNACSKQRFHFQNFVYKFQYKKPESLSITGTGDFASSVLLKHC